MRRALKRQPLRDDWAKDAYCKGQPLELWDLDADPGIYRVGRKHCILDCTIREECLRKAFHQDAEGVVRGGVYFDNDQHRKKKTLCLFCQYPIAPVLYDEDGTIMRTVCWICRRYAPCLKGCGRMVVRKPNVDSYYCKYCSK